MSDFFILLLLVFVFLLAPFGTIFMLNTLFSLGLAYTLKTWLAALILNGMLTVNVKKN